MTETVPPNSSPTALDDGCGLGTVTAELKESFPNLPVVPTDSSAGMINVVDRKAEEHGWKNVDGKVLDGGDLTGTRSSCKSISTHTTSRVAVHFMRKSAHAHAHSTPLHSLYPFPSVLKCLPSPQPKGSPPPSSPMHSTPSSSTSPTTSPLAFKDSIALLPPGSVINIIS